LQREDRLGQGKARSVPNVVLPIDVAAAFTFVTLSGRRFVRSFVGRIAVVGGPSDRRHHPAAA
jgi:hypothetical protein